MHGLARALWGLSLAVALLSTNAQAEADSFGVGTGRSGALSVSTTGLVINQYAVVTQSLNPGDTLIPTNNQVGFSPQDLILVVQMTGLSPVPASGDPGPFDVSSTAVGRWELARVVQTGGSTLQLTAPLVNAYTSPGTQVVRVPEYTSVTVPSGTSVVATPWDGASGGILAFFANATITNNGLITADRAGFPGGAFEDDISGGHSGCVDMDEPPVLGGRKGDGVSPSPFGGIRYGMGNVANAGGGGDCHDSGGGGGGNGSAGGKGGLSYDGDRDVGGRGGGALVYPPLVRLSFGGGGGAGYSHNGGGTAGGRGGGIVFIRAPAVTGSGAITANGESAATSGNDGAGGGGAGGNVYLRFTGDLACSALEARGGKGGDVVPDVVGPGGGGGAGRIVLQARTVKCPICACSGAAGTVTDGGIRQAGAGAIDAGPQALTWLDGGYATPGTPFLTSPSSGTSTPDPRPLFQGIADPGVSVTLLIDGLNVAQGAASADGGFALRPTVDLASGAHSAQAQAEFQLAYSPPSSAVSFTVVAADAGSPTDGGASDGGTADAGSPDAGVASGDGGVPDGGTADGGAPEAAHFEVGCGCGAAPGAAVVPVLFALFLLSRRRAGRSGSDAP